MGKSVRWSNENELFCSTPSSPASSSSPGPSTPPPMSPGALMVAESLRYKNNLEFTVDLSQDPGERSITAISLTQAVTAPSKPQIDIVCSKLPLIIHIRESKEGRGILVGDLFLQLYLALQVQVREEELSKEKPENRQAIEEAFEARCSKLLERSIPHSLQEKDSGVRRIDYLRGHNVFAGFDLVPREVPTLRLHVR